MDYIRWWPTAQRPASTPTTPTEGHTHTHTHTHAHMHTCTHTHARSHARTHARRCGWTGGGLLDHTFRSLPPFLPQMRMDGGRRCGPHLSLSPSLPPICMGDADADGRGGLHPSPLHTHTHAQMRMDGGGLLDHTIDDVFDGMDLDGSSA